MRPGPARLAVRLNPGGYVMHVYAPDGALLWADTVSRHDLERKADDAARATRDVAVTVHVAYDGDTGNRLTPADWLRIAGAG